MREMENVPDHENCQQQQFQTKDNQEKNSSFVIRIPSYDEVAESSQPKTTSPLFNSSSSFTQAFNFIKKTEFYTAPPSSGASNSRQSRSEGPSPSVSESAGPSASVSATASPSTSVSGAAGVSRNSILVSHRQKGNPLLKHIRNVRWAFTDVTCDFLLGQNACALYLSLRYHLLHPDYLYFRIRELQKNFKLRVVLCHVDVEDVVKPLLEVTKTAILHDCTLLCAWSLEECGRYLETIKVYENKPADLIQGQMDMDYQSRLNHALTSLRRVNKTDVVTLGSTFGSLSHIMDASMEDLARCPGIGERKVKGLYDMFHEPFKRVTPNQTSVGEKPMIEQSSEPLAGTKRNEKGKTAVDTNKRSKKEAEMTIKSTLEAAFAKLKERKNKIVAADQGNDDDDFVSCDS